MPLNMEMSGRVSKILPKRIKELEIETVNCSTKWGNRDQYKEMNNTETPRNERAWLTLCTCWELLILSRSVINTKKETIVNKGKKLPDCENDCTYRPQIERERDR